MKNINELLDHLDRARPLDELAHAAAHHIRKLKQEIDVLKVRLAQIENTSERPSKD